MISIFSLQSGVADPTRKAGNTNPVVKGRKTFLQNVVVDRSQLAIVYKRGSLDLSNIVQLTCAQMPENVAAVGHAMAAVTPGAETLSTLVTLQNTIIEPPENTGALKRMSLLQRRPDVDFSKFQHEWFYLHGLLVKRLKGVVGYRQNLVLSSLEGSSRSEVNGMVELWFEDAKAIESAFKTDAGTTLMTHAKEFIGEITTFLVESWDLTTSV